MLFGALVYTLVSVILVAQTDNFLRLQTETIIRELRVSSQGEFDLNSLEQLETLENSVYFQVWGTDRELHFSRPRNWQQSLDPAGRMAGINLIHTTSVQDTRLRVLSVPLVTRRGPIGTLQVGVSLTLVDTVQSSLASILILLAIISMIVAATIASLAITRALAPLLTMTQIAEKITRADDLSRRIPLESQENDEVGTLIKVFNETLARLESLFATQRRFVADVSHELRTPLTVIKGEVSLMRKFGGVDAESLDGIEMEVDRLTRMVGNLLVLAQAESGKLPLDLKPVELDTILLEVFQQLRTLAGGKVQVVVEELEQIQVIADRDRVKQVLLNIAGNAIQYTPPNGKVSLSLKAASGQAQIIITDTGPGIPQEDLPHIFERFYRGEKSRTRSANTGFGLGLSIAYWIVRNHGGVIDVASKVGVGTSFVIRLPVNQEEEPTIKNMSPR